jgi:hypothetical protein
LNGVTERDLRVVQDMWTLANNEPLTLFALQKYGVIDRERYRRLHNGLWLELTLECDERTKVGSYELAILSQDGSDVDPDVVNYWLEAFLGNKKGLASRRSFMLRDARYTFPFGG